MYLKQEAFILRFLLWSPTSIKYMMFSSKFNRTTELSYLLTSQCQRILCAFLNLLTVHLSAFCCLATLKLLGVHTKCSLLSRDRGVLHLMARRILKPHHPLVLLPDQVGGILRRTSMHLFRDICGKRRFK